MFDGGRKLSVGDCALFQAGNNAGIPAPPFIGILRKLTQEKDTTKFTVNWLYRPADVKLAKGGPLEAAPNEVFYSFHKDEISAASLLHPCKVAFLRKGADLPPGVSSFVCRRVYDTANKCLWWLTDRDYTDEHQDEVDQLLERTKLEMQAAVQSGGPSPRAALTGPTSSQLLKSSSDVVQNAAYSAPNKSKKRERTDQSLEPSKRERSVKSEDGDLSPLKRERSMKPEEIASITDKDGGLLNAAGVERLVQLMQKDVNDGHRKTSDVASRRALLAGVMAATEREDCLSRFVVLGGLSMLDDWLQEAHKGKVGDGGSPKEGDKGVEELLLTLLKALDKLPVDLDALKTCSVGKSVNHLRSHKNLEIQKKARKLVDIWKKRVDAEMKQSGEAKSGSNLWNSYKQNSPDMMNSHLMKSGGPTEVAVKSSGAFAGSAKAMPNGVSPGETVGNGAPASVGGKIGPMLASSSPSIVKREENGSSKLTNGTLPADISHSGKEERNGNAVQPQSNGQAWGSGSQGKSVSSSIWKEDVKSASTGGPMSSKPLGTGSRHPSMNGKGLLGAGLSSNSKEMLSGKPLVWTRPTEKMSSSSPAPSEKGSAEGSRDSPNPQHRLIVRIPNPGRSPARNGGAFEQTAPPNRVMSPNVPERSPSRNVDASDSRNRVQSGNATASPEAIAETKNGNVSTGRLVPGVEEREKLGTSVQSDGQAEVEKRGEETTRSEPERNVKDPTEHKSVNGGFTPRNGAAEPVVGSEDGRKVEMGSGTARAPLDAAASEAGAMEVDELGISLLASVAASEIRRTGADEAAHERSQPEATKTELDLPSRVSPDTTSSHLTEIPASLPVEEGVGKEKSESEASQDSLGSNAVKGRDEASAMPCSEGNADQVCDADLRKEGQQDRLRSSGEDEANDGEKKHFVAQNGVLLLEKHAGGGATKSSLDRKGDDSHVGETETESAAPPVGSANHLSKDLKIPVNGSAEGSSVSHDGHSVSKVVKNEGVDERKILGQGKGVELCNGYGSPSIELKNTPAVGTGDVAPERMDRSSAVRSSGPGEGETDLSRCVGGHSDRKGAFSVSEAIESAFDGAQELKRRTMDIRSLGRAPSFQSGQMLGLSSVAAGPAQNHVKPATRALPGGEPTTPEQATETAGPSEGAVGGSDVSERPDFDLNEGFSVEESPQDDSTTSPVAPVPVVGASTPGLSSLLAAPIAIVTATKGGFVLPASPMRTKSELGWKGSAATSAFRPAEPRRTPDRQASAGDNLVPEASTGSTAKKGRPPLDLNIDLNVSDDRNFEEIGIPGNGTASSLSSQGSAIGMGTQVPPTSLSVSGVTFQSEYASSGQPQHAGSSTGRPILDLNMLDESEESETMIDVDARATQHVMVPSAKSNNSSSLQVARRVSVVRDFDLNDGPLVEEAVADDQPVAQPLTIRNTGASMMATGPSLRRGPEVVHSSWFPSNNSLKPAVTDYSSRNDCSSSYSVAAAVAAQSYFNAGAGGSAPPFNPDMYRGNVALTSAPPSAFPSGTQGPYHYGGFAVGNGFPFSTGGSFTPSNVSPYMDSSGSVNFSIPTSGAGSGHLGRPSYPLGLADLGPQDNGHSGWSARPSLDLNAGPEPVDGDGTREELMNSRSAAMLGGQPSLDQMRVLRQVGNSGGPVSGPPLKRKEPENGWDMNRSNGFKQQAWR